MTAPIADRRIADALRLLRDCLSDEEPWPAESLVLQMESVYQALGGDLDDCS